MKVLLRFIVKKTNRSFFVKRHEKEVFLFKRIGNKCHAHLHKQINIMNYRILGLF